jgi:chemotaxis protein methyltransferase CheR
VYPKTRAYIRLKDHLIATTGLAFYADRDERLTELIGGRLPLWDCRLLLLRRIPGRQRAGTRRDGRSDCPTHDWGNLFFPRRGAICGDSRHYSSGHPGAQKSSKQLRIWSAGCATGAEPYSLAILLARDFADRIAGWQIGIDATDLNRGSWPRRRRANSGPGRFAPPPMR